MARLGLVVLAEKTLARGGIARGLENRWAA